MKKLFVVFAFVAAVGSANAAYLYWQVDTSAGDNTASSFTGYNAARIGYYTTSAKGSDQTIADLEAAGLVTYADDVYSAAGGSMGAQATYSVSGADASTFSYFIELVNYNSGTTTHVAYGEDLSYSDLVAKNYVDTGLSVEQLPTIWHGGAFHAVPEPTGALLVAFGLAFLGLKRRRA